MFYRGYYFPSGLTEPAYIDALDGILNSSGSIELWIKPDTIQSATMYSRSSDDNSSVGSEDHVNFTLNATGGYTILLIGRNINTANTENMTLSTSENQVFTTLWQHVSTTWKWTDPSTTIKL